MDVLVAPAACQVVTTMAPQAVPVAQAVSVVMTRMAHPTLAVGSVAAPVAQVASVVTIHMAHPTQAAALAAVTRTARPTLAPV